MNILLINAHQPVGSANGALNASLIERAKAQLMDMGHIIKTTQINAGWDAPEEVEKHLWADVIIFQTPVFWMGVPWIAKKYMDEVYSVGLTGALCNFDGRSSKNPKAGYGTGGTQTDTAYMLSLTFNAPIEAFDDPSEYLFEGRSVDDLFLPQHLCFRFFGMKALPTFACHDVKKNPEIEADFARFDAHLRRQFA
ncbi:MAG: NAD(P)H-dependent oxidoreductase [Halocynthiibacter sp.]